MKKEEKNFQKLLLSKLEKYEDKPEIAEKYARWLLSEKRYEDATLVTYTALDEGPRFDLYEMRAFSNLIGLEELWAEIHKEQSISPKESSTEIYNRGMSNTDPNWADIIKKIKNK